MRLLIIGNYHQGIGGISGVIDSYLHFLRLDGYEVDLFSTSGSFYLKPFLFFKALLCGFKYDIYHAHGCSYWGFLPITLSILIFKMIFRKKVVVTYHGGGARDYLGKRSRIVPLLLSKADQITVMSVYLHEVFMEYNLRTIIVPNLIKMTVDKSFIPEFNTPKLVSIRSHEEVYNIDDIIEVYAKIKQRYNDATLKIYGTGTLEKELRLKAKNLGIDVDFVGLIPSEAILVELKKSNIMLSLPSKDNQPISLLQSFAAGIPVISTNVGGIPDIIKDGWNGFLVEVHDPDAVVEKIEWIMRNIDEVNMIVKTAKCEIERYTWKNLRSTIYSLYGQVL